MSVIDSRMISGVITVVLALVAVTPLCGLLAFLGIAVLSGWISATVRGYPYFIL